VSTGSLSAAATKAPRELQANSHNLGQLGRLRPLAVGLAQAGRIIGVSKFTIRRMISRGVLRGVRAGRRWVVPVTSLEEFLSVSVEAVPNSDERPQS
jgi:excisionase family DNA binding protein